MFEPISRIIKNRVAKLSFNKEILAVSVRQLWPETLIDLFNDKVAGLTQALYFQNGTLTIKIANSVLIQELQSQKEEIINLLNKKLGQNVVKRLSFKI